MSFALKGPRFGRIFDVALLGLAVWTGLQFYRSAYPPPRVADPPLIKIGDQFNLGGIRLAPAAHAVVIFGDPKCGACRENAPFLRALTDVAKVHTPRIQVIVAGEAAEEALTDWAREASFAATDIVSIGPPLAHGLLVTPTIMCVEHGRIQALFVGKVPAELEDDWLAHLASGQPLVPEMRGPIEIGLAEFEKLSRERTVTLLDPRERDEFNKSHKLTAINLPHTEVPVRAALELDRDKPIVITCTGGTYQCRAASMSLLDFSREPVRLWREDKR